MDRFDDPEERVDRESRQFGVDEPGITHPKVPGYIRIRNDGAIELIADDGLGLIIDPSSRSVTFVADHVKFFTKEEGGLRWNDLQFNDRATHFDEPTFIEVDDDGSITDLYKDSFWFLDDDEDETVEDIVNKIWQSRQRILNTKWTENGEF